MAENTRDPPRSGRADRGVGGTAQEGKALAARVPGAREDQAVAPPERSMQTTLPPPDAMAAIVSGVTETMLGLTFRADLDGAAWSQLMWRAAVLPIAGASPITVGLSSDRPGCEALGARMFQVRPELLSDEMLSDSLCELVNMTAGLLKAHLRLEQPLGLPKLMPQDEPAFARSAGRSCIVLRAESLGLVLWVFEGLL